MFAFVSVSLSLALSSAAAEAADKTPPEFTAEKWYNTAPLSLADLKGKAVLLQVFRTW